MFFFKRQKQNEEVHQISSQENQKKVDILNKVLLVIDASKASLAATDYAIQLAQQTKGELIAIYVVDTETMDYLKNLRILADTERQFFEKQIETSGKHILDNIKQKADKLQISNKTILSRGVFHKEVLICAAQEQANLIIVGGWARTITRKDKPSVERQLIMDEASCPVLIIKEGYHVANPADRD